MAEGNRPNRGAGSQIPPNLGTQPLGGLPAGDLKKTFTSAGTANDALTFTNRDLSGGHRQVSTIPSSKDTDTKQ